jgi:D-3-phosphoglycerate dehydrogenase
MTHTILVTAPRLASAGTAVLESAQCRTIFLSDGGGIDEMLDILRNETVDGVVSRTLPLNAEAIAASSRLRVISRHGVGYNNVDVAAATARRIPVLIAGGANSQSVAELAIALMLAVARQVDANSADVRRGVWDRSQSGLQLRGKILGLVALGSIGRAVAAIAQGMGMSIFVYDPYLEEEPLGITKVNSLEDLLDVADVVSLHCPLTEATRNIIDERAIGLMKPGSMLINTARGGLVDEAALARAICSDHLGGAGLDTLTVEPPSQDHPLLGLRRVVLTPHIGGSTDTALAETAALAARNALAVLDGLPLPMNLVVNPETL